ncbi:MAG TPA: POTRA domain-containing protein, partial [Thermoanaerobaculia bacterium]|nr:POTRA domain-containing protein [Thermoanaerobaculia bacterium]
MHPARNSTPDDRGSVGLRRLLGASLWAAALLIPCAGAGQTAVPSPSPTPSASQAPAASSAEATQGKPGAPAPVERIVGIRVVGYQTVSPETIAHYLGVKTGDPYDPEKIRSNFQALWEVGLLENIAIEAEHSAAGVTLVVTIEERPIIKQVEFTGNKKFSNSQIKDRLKEEKVEIREGAPLSLRNIAKTRSVIADYYAENGYRSATVDYRIEDISKTEKKVIFAVDEGDKIKIAAINFQGNHVVSAMRLRNAMKKTKVNTWFRLLSETSTTYSQANYDADVESIKAVYHSKGYKDVVVKDPVLDIFVKNPKAPAKKQKKNVRITIPLVEGDQFFIGTVQVIKVDQSGAPEDASVPLVVPREVQLKEFRDIPPGSVLNRDLLIEALSKIETRYKKIGYIYWFADPTYRDVGNHRVDVDVKLFEGDKFYLGRLEVTGNTTTRDKVVRREFALDEGDVMNMEAVKKSLQKLQQLGYFKVNEEPEFAVRAAEKKVDLTLKGTETSRNE